jgi:dienelactone hydrolase
MRRSRPTMAALMALWTHLGTAAQAAEPHRITIPAPGIDLRGELFRPEGEGPFPAIIALHGCGGIYRRDGKQLGARHNDWAQRLVAAGFVVLFPDSFNSRGFAEICTLKDRLITAKARADDVAAATRWIATQPFVDQNRLALLGWSHGASTTLWAIGQALLPDGPKFKTAIAFYPGCSAIARAETWRPQVPLTILMGGADDWTPPAPCRDLASRTGLRYVEFPDAYHGFDVPNEPVRVRTGLALAKGGQAHIGTNAQAREAAIVEVMKLLAAVR